MKKWLQNWIRDEKKEWELEKKINNIDTDLDIVATKVGDVKSMVDINLDSALSWLSDLENRVKLIERNKSIKPKKRGKK